jgi:hypothetical protein
MSLPNLQTPVSRIAPPAWESTPWIPEERTIDEPRLTLERPLRLSDEHIIEASLAGDSIRAAT